MRSLRSISAKGNISLLQKLQTKVLTLECFWHFLWKINLHCTHSIRLLGWLFFLLQVRQTGIPLLSEILVCFGNVPNSLWILVESNEIHEMVFLRQSQQNQGSLLLLNISKPFVSRRKHFLWSHLFQQSQKMHSCFLPITLAHFPHLYTPQSGQDQYKFLFSVWLWIQFYLSHSIWGDARHCNRNSIYCHPCPLYFCIVYTY